LFKNNKEEFHAKTCGTQVIEEDVITTLEISETPDGTITDKWSKDKSKFLKDQLITKLLFTETNVTELDITITNICAIELCITCTETKLILKLA